MEFLDSKQSKSLRDYVEKSLEDYFSHLEGVEPSKVYEMVMAEIEPPLIRKVLEYTKNNQSKASKLLGLNRATLRKKMEFYSLE